MVSTVRSCDAHPTDDRFFHITSHPMLTRSDAAHASAFKAEVRVGNVEVIEQLADDWRSLCDESAYGAPFYRPEWIAAYVRAFARDKSVAVATVRMHGRVIAVLPLVREISLLGGVPARKLRGAANVHTCRYDLVHRADAVEAAIPALWSALEETPGWDVLELPNVPARSGVEKLAQHAQGEGCAVQVVPAEGSPYVALPDHEAPFDTLLARLDSKFRSNLRRRMRRLQGVGAVALVETRKVDARLAQFYALERSGWKGAEQSAIECDDSTRHFYDEISSYAERCGYLYIYALECEGRPVAMHLGLREGTRYFLLKTAYDEVLKDCSPGQLITQEVLRSLAAERCQEFDFLGVPMDWKTDWAPQLRPHATWYVFRGTAGRMLHALRFGVRPTFGRMWRAWERAEANARPPGR